LQLDWQPFRNLWFRRNVFESIEIHSLSGPFDRREMDWGNRKTSLIHLIRHQATVFPVALKPLSNIASRTAGGNRPYVYVHFDLGAKRCLRILKLANQLRDGNIRRRVGGWLSRFDLLPLSLNGLRGGRV